MPDHQYSARFKFVVRATLVLVYLVIIAGGIVRSTGSGLGCPDWPRCFGKWVPPTNISQLPSDYKNIYRVAGKTIADFSPVKTWIEYINRLMGVLVGFFIGCCLVFSFRYRKTDPQVTVLAFVSFVLVCVQGWIGATVVSTHLAPYIISVHMAVALVLVMLLLNLTYRVSSLHHSYAGLPKKTFYYVLIAFLLTAIQIVVGTQVRQQIDEISLMPNLNRNSWVDHIGIVLTYHRLLAYSICLLHVFIVFKLFRFMQANSYGKYLFFLISLILVEYVAGLVLVKIGFPAFVQPVHLVLACIIFGVQYYALLFLFQHTVKSSSLSYASN